MIMIGSTAIKHHFPDFPREPKDVDYAVDYIDESRKSTKLCEYHLNPIIGYFNGIANPNLIYTLKISHLIGWDIQWEKHMWDVQFLKNKGCLLNKHFFL